MADITLKSGKVIAVDVSELTVKEYREFTDSGGDPETENKVLGKCTGLTAGEIENMSYIDSRKIIRAILTEANDPLKNPN